MDIRENMQFEVTSKFIPNFCNAKTLKITDINDTTVRIEMEDARSRGAFPKLQFLSLVRSGALIMSNEELANQEGTA